MPATIRPWRQVAWNGLSFQAPRDWEPARIGARYLLLDDGAGPVMEVKWSPVRGKFSHAAQLKRLGAGRGRKGGAPPAPADLPPRWAAALEGFEARGFAWGSGGSAGRGAILFCPVCRQAAMVQFVDRGLARGDAARILASYRDHEGGDWRTWSLFDIRARVPAGFELLRHRFGTGCFELAFGSRRQKLCLHRWAPARALLSQTDLAGFARQRIGFPGGAPVLAPWRGRPALEWALAPSPAPGARWWSRFKAGTPYKWLRLWHLETENRILGVRAEGRRPFDPGLLEEVCTAYEVV